MPIKRKRKTGTLGPVEETAEGSIYDQIGGRYLVGAVVFVVGVAAILIVMSMISNITTTGETPEALGEGGPPSGDVPVAENNNSNDNVVDDDNSNVGYTEIYYPIDEIPDAIRLDDGEGQNALILTIEDIEIENEIISFNMVYQRQKIGTYPKLTVRVDYFLPNAPDVVFKRTYTADTNTFQIGEKRFQEFGKDLSVQRKEMGEEPATITRIRIDGI